MQLIVAARNGDPMQVAALSTPMLVFIGGWAPLHFLASEGSSKGVELLISNGADVTQTTARNDLSAPGCFGETALHLAVRGGFRNTVATLLAAGSPTEQYDTNGLLPLHVAALTEVVPLNALYPHMKGDFDWGKVTIAALNGSVVEQLLCAGADPWARTFNRDMKLPWELADNGFYIDFPTSTRTQLKIKETGGGYQPGGSNFYYEHLVNHELGYIAERAILPTDSRQTNDVVKEYLKHATQPGTAVFEHLRAIEAQRFQGDETIYNERNAGLKNKDREWLAVAKEDEAWLVGDPYRARWLALFRVRAKLEGIGDVDNPTQIEMDAVLARGRAEDMRRMRFTITDLSNTVNSLSFDLEQTRRSFDKSHRDLLSACGTIDELTTENDALRTENDALRSQAHEPSTSNRTTNLSYLAVGGGSFAPRRGARSSSSSSCSDSDSRDASSPQATADTESPSKSPSRGKAKLRKADQARKARELVASGKVLTRVAIADLSKAEARAFLGCMKGKGVRGNLAELHERLRSVFDASKIDSFKVGDDIPGKGVHFSGA